MLLTLQDAIKENDSYTWKFPQINFMMSIQSFNRERTIQQNKNIDHPIYDTIFKVYEGTKQEIGQLVIIPSFVPAVFDYDYFTIRFTNIEQTDSIFPTELTIELIEL